MSEDNSNAPEMDYDENHQDAADDDDMERERRVAVPNKLLLSAVQRANESTQSRPRRDNLDFGLSDPPPRGRKGEGKRRGENGRRDRRRDNGNAERRPRPYDRGPRHNRQRDEDGERVVKFVGKRARDDQEEETGNTSPSKPATAGGNPALQICTFFPNCKYGTACQYVHPALPCKFGLQCTNPMCQYSHPPPASTFVNGGAHAVPCRYGAYCTKGAACPFLHTGTANRFASLSANQSAIPCKFGAQCHFKNTTCKFQHPGEAKDGATTAASTPAAASADAPKTEEADPQDDGLDLDDIPAVEGDEDDSEILDLQE